AVYGKENQPCPNCATPIARVVQTGRSTFYCKVCQKK
ncbi:MAG: bifunctional DNA-formamidopyrimidine glycosylase/DNA-(apurinic or apyrimidinic site) lyase, partial [Nitrospinae bacterium]|nr:bifunctional DNA-formamidopyrimidine glycosylase/DNA-(apurinic or apyrimidinic site) lyase [Nitrospinota bacterium]